MSGYRHTNNTLFPPKREPSKLGSWWLDLDREAFQKQHAIEQLRLTGTSSQQIVPRVGRPTTNAGHE